MLSFLSVRVRKSRGYAVCSAERQALHLAEPADEAAEDVEQEDDEDEGEGGAPDAVQRRLQGLVAVLVDHRGQRAHEAAEEVGRDDLGVGREDEQRGRLAHDPGEAEQDAGDDARERRRDDDLHDRLPLRHAERVGRLAQARWGRASISSVERTTVGIMSIVSAKQTAMGRRWKPKVVTHTA